MVDGLILGEDTIAGRKAGGHAAALTPAEVLTMLGISAGDAVASVNGDTGIVVVSALLDATALTPLLVADDGVVTLQDDVEFLSHGKLDTNSGFTPTGTAEGRLPTWYDPSHTVWSQGGWFAFGFDPADGRVTQHWGSGTVEGASIISTTDLAQLNLFLQAGQTGVTEALILWDEDGNKSLTFADPNVDGGSDGPNATVWWAPNGTDQVVIYSIDGNPEIDVVSATAACNFFAVDNYVETNWHKRPNDGRGAFLRGGDDNYLRIIAASGQVQSLLVLQTAASADILNISTTGATLSLPLAMASHKITGLSNGSASDDAAAFGQIGTAVGALSTVYQPLDSDLTAIAALTTTVYGRAFLALADAAAGRAALGLGTAALVNTGTGATNAILGNDARLTDSRTPTAHASSHASAGSDPLTLAESQVTNLVTDLAAKAPLASPTFTGNPTAPTATVGDNDTSIATTAFVQRAATPHLYLYEKGY
jgi:hypothetical protein